MKLIYLNAKMYNTHTQYLTKEGLWYQFIVVHIVVAYYQYMLEEAFLREVHSSP